MNGAGRTATGTAGRYGGRFASLPVLACLCSLLGCDAARDEAVAPAFSGSTMGTQYHVRLARIPQGVSLETVQSRVEETLELVNAQMSTWRDDSEISQFNRYEGTDWFAVSTQTAQVVHEAQRISLLTGGRFDVTVGPLVNLWRFGPEQGELRVPSDSAIAEAKERTGYDKLEVMLDPPALRKSHPNLEVDLSAIAKGFGVDQVFETVSGNGARGFLVEIGGEMRAHGVRPDKTPWQVGIEKPTENQRAVQFVLPLLQRSLATSGDYRNFYEVDGMRYSHTIDPRTGRPVASSLASVSVVDESCMRADALATALMVLGPEDAYNFSIEHEIAALLITRDGSGYREQRTPEFEDYIAEASLHSPQAALEHSATSMTTTFVAALIVVGLALAGMAIGVIVGNRRLRGSCGGLSSMRDSQGRSICDACTSPSENCTGVPPGPREHAESEVER